MYRGTLLVALLLLLSGCQGVEEASISPHAQSTTVSPVPEKRPSVSPTASVVPAVSPSNGSTNLASLLWNDFAEPDDETFRYLAVGTGTNASFDGSVEVVVRNEADETQTVTTTVAAGVENETVYEASPRVPAGRSVQFDVRQSGQYRFSVDSGEETKQFVLSSEQFDCNAKLFGFHVHANGTITQQQTTTLVACSSPN